MDLKLGFFASHNGSNIEAILDRIDSGNLNADAKVIISNNPDARVLDLGKSRGVPYFCMNNKNTNNLSDTILNVLKENDVNLIILAGYMKKMDVKILHEYQDRVLNIHPSLLPKYGGQGMYGINVHKAVIDSADVESGATIHLVNENYDDGRILAQYKVPVYSNDTPYTLADRVLSIEHVLYPQTLIDIERGLISLD